MTRVSLNTKFKLGQIVYYIKNVNRRILVCANCNSFRNEYRKVVMKSKIKDITFAGSMRAKPKTNTYQYVITGGYGLTMNEKDLYATKEEAEFKREHSKGTY